MPTLSNIPLYSGNLNELTSGIIQSNLVISKLKSATTIIDIGSATAPASNQVLTAISSSNAIWANQTAPSGGGGDTFVSTSLKTASYTAVKNDEVLVDTNGAAGDVTISLPATPTVGDQVRIVLITDHATRVCKIARNGNNWKGSTTALIEDTSILVIKGDNITCKFMGGTCGWTVIYNNLKVNYGELYPNAVNTVTNGTIQTLNFNTVIKNIGSICDTTNFRFNVRRNGIYQLQFHPFLTYASATQITTGGGIGVTAVCSSSVGFPPINVVWYRVNGTTPTNNYYGFPVQSTCYLKAGDYYYFRVRNNVGRTIAFVGTAGAVYGCNFSCKEIH
jgi:hypothetical protein